MESAQPTSENLVKELSLPICQSKGWMKLLGVLSIFWGISIALSVVGLVVAWVPIWMGVMLYQAANSAELALYTGDRAALTRALSKLRLFFTVMGLLALLSLLLLAASIILGLSAHVWVGHFWVGHMWRVPMGHRM